MSGYVNLSKIIDQNLFKEAVDDAGREKTLKEAQKSLLKPKQTTLFKEDTL